MSKLLRAALRAEDKIEEVISSHKLLKTAIFVEENAGRIKNAILRKAVLGLTILSNKLQIK